MLSPFRTRDRKSTRLNSSHHEQSLGNCVGDGIGIYIMIAHDINIFFFYMKYLMINVDELQVMKFLTD